jgi:hypothetical protein
LTTFIAIIIPPGDVIISAAGFLSYGISLDMADVTNAYYAPIPVGIGAF